MADFGFDDWIDAQLRNVALPPKFLERLAEAGSRADPEDAQLDSELRNVPVPAALPVKLRRIARRRRTPPVWQRVAMAASLFLLIGLGIAGYLAVTSGALDPDRGKLAKQQPAAKSSPLPAVKQKPSAQPPSVLASDAKSEPEPAPVAEKMELEPIQPVQRLNLNVADNRPAKVETPAKQPEPSALGTHGTLVSLPDLAVFDGQQRGGLSPPLVRGYDLLFELRQGEHPFVSPSAHQQLEATRLPFSFRTTSFDEALRTLRSDRLPPADEIRVEDFLAAQEYALPKAPRGGLALHIAGSQSPFSASDATPRGGRLHMLQLAVQASSYDSQKHQPNWLIVAFDASAQMDPGARFIRVRRALAKLAQHMGDGDRVTLVRFAAEPTTVAEKITAGELAKLAWSDVLAPPSGSPSLTRGIEAAWRVARDTSTLEPRHVIVITGDRGNFDRAALPPTVEKLGELTSMRIPWRIVRVSADDKDLHWDKVAVEGRGKIVSAASADSIYAALFEALINWKTNVAEGVSVTVKFSPQAVAAYRLLGHEATTLTGLEPEPVSVDLDADQTAVGLFEVALKPGADKIVGTVEVAWTHPPNGQAARIVKQIQRDELSGSFSQAPAWLQQGTIAAKAAECLRGSYYTLPSRSMHEILELAARVDPAVAGQQSFKQLVELLEKAEKLR